MQNLMNRLIAMFLFISSSYTCEAIPGSPYVESPFLPPLQYFPGSSIPLPSSVSHPFGYNGFNRQYFELSHDLNYNLHHNLNQLNHNLHRNLNHLDNNLNRNLNHLGNNLNRNLNHLGNYNNFYDSGYYGYDF